MAADAEIAASLTPADTTEATTPAAVEPSSDLPKWCTRRSLERYNELTNLALAQMLMGGGLYIDYGCGHGVALNELAAASPRAELVGVNWHQLEPDLAFFHHVFANIPQHASVHAAYGGQALATTDIYGPASYCDNPLEALIYEASTLGPCGTSVVYSEGERFHPASWRNIERFFLDATGQHVDFTEDPNNGTGDTPTALYRRRKGPVKGDELPWQNCVRVTVHGQASGRPLDSLFAEARQQVGAPRRERLIWQTLDGLAQIHSVRYAIS